MLLGADRRPPFDYAALAYMDEAGREAAWEADRQFSHSEEGRRFRAAERVAKREIKLVGSNAWTVAQLAIRHGVQPGEDHTLGQLVGYYAICLIIEWLAPSNASIPKAAASART